MDTLRALAQREQDRLEGRVPFGLALVDNDGNPLMGSTAPNPSTRVVVSFLEGIAPRPPEKLTEPTAPATRANALSDADKALLSRCGR